MHLRGHDEAGHGYPIDDPLAAELAALHARATAARDSGERAATFTRFAPVFGDLADVPGLVAPLARALDALASQGAATALQRYTR
jgi:mannitol-1-phosphate/altronate dehydrogenase